MPNHETDRFETYCLRCQAPANETAIECASCHTPFTGSGAFDRISGPRPSALFLSRRGASAS